MFMNKAFEAGVGAVFALGLSASVASAVTVMEDDGVYIVGPGLETSFIGDIKDSTGGAGDWMVTFDSTTAGSAEALVTIGDIVWSTFENLTLEWWDADDNTVLSSIPVTPIVTTLSTSFVAPDLLDQKLVLTWTDSLVNAGFDIEVSVAPVPLPFAGALLLSGIAGLGLLRRKRTT